MTQNWLARALPRAPLAVLVAACGAAPPAVAHVEATVETVTITATALLPAAEVRIPVFATVVFLNGLEQGAVEVVLERALGDSAGCATTLHFRAEDGRTVARGITPRAVASVCFHEAGRFPFIVRTAAGEQRGAVVVGGAL